MEAKISINHCAEFCIENWNIEYWVISLWCVYWCEGGGGGGGGGGQRAVYDNPTHNTVSLEKWHEMIMIDWLIRFNLRTKSVKCCKHISDKQNNKLYSIAYNIYRMGHQFSSDFCFITTPIWGKFQRYIE